VSSDPDPGNRLNFPSQVQRKDTSSNKINNFSLA
jgi:hypothetical protein